MRNQLILQIRERKKLIGNTKSTRDVVSQRTRIKGIIESHSETRKRTETNNYVHLNKQIDHFHPLNEKRLRFLWREREREPLRKNQRLLTTHHDQLLRDETQCPLNKIINSAADSQKHDVLLELR